MIPRKTFYFICSWLWLVVYGLIGLIGLMAEAKKPEQSIKLDVAFAAEQFTAWSKGNVRVTIENTDRIPLLLLGVQLMAENGEIILAPACVIQHVATIRKNDILLEGAYWVEDLGPIARAPRPPAWRWEGGDTVALCLLLMPGERMEWSTLFRARYDLGEQLLASVEYARLTPDFLLYQATTPEVKRKKHEAETFFGKWESVATLRVTYQPAQTFVKGNHEVAVPDFHEAPRLFNYATPVAALAALPKQKLRQRQELHILHEPFDIADARKACGVASGDYTRAVAAQLWVVAGTGVTHLVGIASCDCVAGDCLPLANALNDTEKHAVTLFSWQQERDAHGHLAYFSKLGFTTEAREQKGGNYEGIVIVAPSQLLAFVKALQQRGLKMDGAAQAKS